eukprot:CAMPEP_0202712924 /NCGR_PEP_ID=MMETSP1385-20130828/47569_1 /ASSEMBLY_ACC=CAM_ASM_000861 /TAXON_ID=933848 /ORGANISM="Elphidium margaritaceum" /LENGTH=273 /DNA_ID=CAMNT_0049373117 /DNA_START=41 /DNA_END=862 /DNA_ORIENTATION=-
MATQLTNETSKDDDTKRRLLVDTFVGITAGFTLSWFITPLDSAVMDSMASSKQVTITSSLRDSMKQICTRPHRYLMQPQFGYVFGTYSSTYLAKNYTDTVCKATHQTAEITALYKFWLVFAVNGGLSVFWKDPGLARIIRSKYVENMAKTSGPVSMRMTYLCWMARDTVHIFGASVLPDYIEQKFHLSHKQWQLAQLTFPLMVQLLTTPMHLLGLDYYNHTSSDRTFMQRMTRVRADYLGAAGIRMIRMWAPWSIGLLINRELRDSLNGDQHH